jgi:D-tyrosyl-tRNA(Tyr) deacylase
LILQRVSRATVRVDGETIGSIDRGILVLVGVERGDGPEQAEGAAAKLAALRIFDDEVGRMNLDAAAVGGSFLVVSQFTLAGSLARGRRPSFDGAAPPEEAEPLVEGLCEALRRRGLPVAGGRFRARMEVELVNDGPVTFVLDLRSEGREGAPGAA